MEQLGFERPTLDHILTPPIALTIHLDLFILKGKWTQQLVGHMLQNPCSLQGHHSTKQDRILLVVMFYLLGLAPPAHMAIGQTTLCGEAALEPE